jgi:hypothetical protein
MVSFSSEVITTAVNVGETKPWRRLPYLNVKKPRLIVRLEVRDNVILIQ